MFKKLKSQVQEAVNEKLTQLAATNTSLTVSGNLSANSNLEVSLRGLFCMAYRLALTQTRF